MLGHGIDEASLSDQLIKSREKRRLEEEVNVKSENA